MFSSGKWGLSIFTSKDIMNSKWDNAWKPPVLAQDRHSITDHSFFSFYQVQNLVEFQASVNCEKGSFGGERLPKCQLPSPLSPSNHSTLEISGQCREHTFSSSRGCQSWWDIWARQLPLLILPWSFKYQISNDQVLLFRIWLYFGVKPSVISFSNFPSYVSHTLQSPTSITWKVCSPLRAPDAVSISGTDLFVWKSALCCSTCSPNQVNWVFPWILFPLTWLLNSFLSLFHLLQVPVLPSVFFFVPSSPGPLSPLPLRPVALIE